MTNTIFNKCRCLVPLVGFLIILTYISDVNGGECKCPLITSRRGVSLTCKNSQGSTIDCSSPASSLTIVDYKCHQFYRPAIRGSATDGRLQCSQDCIWQNRRRLEEFFCEIDCGKPSQPHIRYIAKGQKTLRYSWPWHATIFVKDEKTLQIHYICGGTLISEHVVLTAAHCLITLREYPLESYHVVLGSISSNWTENMDDPYAQFFRINRNFVPEEYDRVEQRSDIALVELNKQIVLSEAVSPACFPYDNDIAKPQEPVVDGEGEVVGYGKNEDGEYEQYLKYTRLPVLGAAKCYDILEKRQGIEQFCAGVENGSAVCNGDSGGGMVFKGQGMSRYYVQGVVSHGLSNRYKVTCDGLSYFTNVLYFIKWVTTLVDIIREKNEWMYEEHNSTQYSVVAVHEPSTTPAVPANIFIHRNGDCTQNLMEEYVDITCKYQGGLTDCSNAPNGTIATYRCKYPHLSMRYSTISRMCINSIWTKRDIAWECSIQCGIPANNSTIKNLPWNVVLYQKSKTFGKLEYFCGGTLVSDRVIITAAHCVQAPEKRQNPSEITLLFGRPYGNVSTDDENVVMGKVERIIVHESYGTPLSGFDIAILITDKVVKMSESVRPVCLPGRKVIYAGALGTIIGWKTDTPSRGLVMESTIPIVLFGLCANSDEENNFQIQNPNNIR